MKIIEERYLKSEIRKLNKYTKENQSFLGFFDSIDFLMKKTLQDLSFKSDLNFFDEISFILSVITSIIAHPHLLNKGEEIIVRSELASNVSPDMFQKTLRNSLLWSEKGIDEMVPEYVYHYQQIDELRIYENIFVVMLVKMIEQELQKYNDFYISTILTFNNQESLSVRQDNADIALKRMKMLSNRIKHIKNTFFYKEVNKVNTRLGHIHPTNILLKDRLYNYCFKFYRKMVTYSDNFSRLKDIRLFYFVQFIKVIKEKGFSPSRFNDIELDEKHEFVIPRITFESKDYLITIDQNEEYTGLVLEVENKLVRNQKLKDSKHLLLFDSKASFSSDNYNVNKDEFDTIEILSLWNLGYFNESIKTLYQNPVSEKDMMKEWINSKLYYINGSKKIYSMYCPVCKSQNIMIDKQGRYICEKCNSKYTFFKGKNGDNIWFNRLRRGF